VVVTVVGVEVMLELSPHHLFTFTAPVERDAFNEASSEMDVAHQFNPFNFRIVHYSSFVFIVSP
jgi:hypothetical protein